MGGGGKVGVEKEEEREEEEREEEEEEKEEDVVRVRERGEEETNLLCSNSGKGCKEGREKVRETELWVGEGGVGEGGVVRLLLLFPGWLDPP